MSKVKTPKEFREEKKTSKGIKKVLSVKQWFWLILGILISVNAVTFLTIGLISDYGDLAYDIFEAANTGMKTALGGLDFKWFGVVTFVVGTLIYSLALSSSSKDEDREKEKNARREQRLKAMEEARNQGVVVDFTSSSASENNSN